MPKSEFTKNIRFIPAYDYIGTKKAKYGICGMKLFFELVGPKGVVTFDLMTPILPERTLLRMDKDQNLQRDGMFAHAVFSTRSFGLALHTKGRLPGDPDYYHYNGVCEYHGKDCWNHMSSMLWAEQIVWHFIEAKHPDAYLWKTMRMYYNSFFKTKEVTDGVKKLLQ